MCSLQCVRKSLEERERGEEKAAFSFGMLEVPAVCEKGSVGVSAILVLLKKCVWGSAGLK